MKGLFALVTLALLPFRAAIAQDFEYEVIEVDDDYEIGQQESPVGTADTTPTLHVSVSASFPQSEIFGVKLVNGRPTQALVSISNDEPAPVYVRLMGGSLWTPSLRDQPPRLLRNLSATVFNAAIPAGEKESLTYSFTTELHPQDLLLQLAAIITDEAGASFTLPIYNETVSVVEAPTSIFDPQILFLYLVLAALFAGTSYFIYNTWITTLFPQQKKTRAAGKGGERAKTSSRGSKKVDPSEQASVAGADGPAVTSSSQTYDESWIPSHHIQRPQAKRIRSGTPSGVKTKSRQA